MLLFVLVLILQLVLLGPFVLVLQQTENVLHHILLDWLYAEY
jgi:hypothetical protein